MKAEGFAETKLLLTEGKARASLVKRVAAANNLPANLFLSVHHDPCPRNFSRTGNSMARKAVSATASAAIPCSSPADNPEYKTSLSIAELLAKEMKAQGLQYAEQYTQPIMGRTGIRC